MILFEQLPYDDIARKKKKKKNSRKLQRCEVFLNSFVNFKLVFKKFACHDPHHQKLRKKLHRRQS